jgi:hypothetical protein
LKDETTAGNNGELAETPRRNMAKVGSLFFAGRGDAGRHSDCRRFPRFIQRIKVK